MWKQVTLVTLTTLLLFACGTPATAAPPPSSTPAPPPPPTATLPPPTATLEPSPTPDPLIFRDDFDGALDEGWQWIAEKPAYWSLTTEPGWLRITARAGRLIDGSITNLLVQEAPDGNYELETRLKFRPGGNYQIGALLIYQANRDYVAFGRAFCDNIECSGNGYYLDLIRGGGLVENFATKAPDTDVVLLRLRREGNTYTGYASQDGTNWQLIGAHETDLRPLFVGLMAGQAVKSVPRVAAFDYFTITALR